MKKNGYGRFNKRMMGRRHHYAHRLAYADRFGPAPTGLDVDHNCHNESDCAGGMACLHRACCNPRHLRAVTRSVNLKAGRVGENQTRPPRTHCKYEHELTPENTYVWPKDGRRMCRECLRRNQRATQRRKRERAA